MPEIKMQLQFLPVNQCWAFTLGDSIISIDDVDGSRPRLFLTREEAISMAKRVGLEVTKSGAVFVADKGE